MDKKGLLAAISSSISLAEANISNVNARTIGGQRGISTFELEVSDIKHLQRVIKSIEKVKGVIKVSRLTP
jgi:GTP pyrophosphokinase